MGNSACCQSHPVGDSKITEPIHINKQPLQKSQIKPQPQPIQDEPQIPALYSTVEKTLNHHQFFKEHFDHLQNRKVKNFGSDVYEGQLNENKRPHGYGKMYKQNGSLFLGHFDNGKAHGNGAYIFPDGSYYKGQFYNNNAHDQHGHYKSQNLEYNGGFVGNVFHNNGTQTGAHHSYKGTYYYGRKWNGQLRWKDNDGEYSYTGSFNDHDKFHGQGHLTQPKGSYQGHFDNGLKSGKGQYKSINGLRYVGDYLHDKRNGSGIIYNQDNTIAYQGQIKDGMPHGKGRTYNNGILTQTNWIQGIDSRVIHQ